jgi:hypothetical protein
MNVQEWLAKEDFTDAERERIAKEFGLKEATTIKEDQR